MVSLMVCLMVCLMVYPKASPRRVAWGQACRIACTFHTLKAYSCRVHTHRLMASFQAQASPRKDSASAYPQKELAWVSDQLKAEVSHPLVFLASLRMENLAFRVSNH